MAAATLDTTALSARLQSIDSLRGVAALAVVGMHAMLYGQPPAHVSWLARLYAFAHHGAHGVTLFFLISGFCIHLRWASRQAATGQAELDFLIFWKRRLHRLYPPYFVALCLSMGLVVGACVLGQQTAVVASYPGPKARWLGLDFIAHALMLHGFHPVLDWGAGNPPFWTLAREEHFYLLYFPLLWWRRRVGLWGALGSTWALGYAFPIALAAILPLRAPYLDFLGSTVVLSSAIVLWYQWALGMVAVEAYYGLAQLPRWCYQLWLVPLCCAVAVSSGNLSNLTGLSDSCWLLALFLLINGCVACERQGRWPDHFLLRWLARVGIFSYSLYLIHMPVLSSVQRVLPGNATSNPWVYMLNALVILLVSCGVGCLFFQLVERHFLNTRRVPVTRGTGQNL